MDQLPHAAGRWKEKVFSFPDHPEEQFVLRYRDALEAVKTLLGDPTFADDIVYKPRKLFSQGKRVRTEMWTGDWWWTLHVGEDKFSVNILTKFC